ncbi:MAG: glnA [Alphaproteobacteria bacterium]|nr:glnA [Alphaproteobacteria bacterium]
MAKTPVAQARKTAKKLAVKTKTVKPARRDNRGQQLVDFLLDNEFTYVDFRFTDLRGKLHHLTHHISTIDTDLLDEGILFDGSSIAGWKAINESDMLLMPDLSTAHGDPFAAQPTMNILCNIVDPQTGAVYNRDPRSIALAAENYVSEIGLADTVNFGPEAEFFIFDDARFKTQGHRSVYSLDSDELPDNSDFDYEGGNTGHRPRAKGGYFPVPPIDSLNDIRGEMTSFLADMGVDVEKHHHEVAPGQCELGVKYKPLTIAADVIQHYKYVVHNVAHEHGKTATFMPKPLFGDNGSGMHCHQSLFKDGQPLFAGDKYNGLSEMALFYIGGIIKHARALNAFTNPTTNSYKRLVPGYEAPVLLAYSARNRSASCRIPHGGSPFAKRIEVRFPDPAANPYLAFAAQLMAGLDGIANRIHPGDAMDMNLYELPEKQLRKIPTVCRTLREALESLEADNAFLLQGGVFTPDLIDAYIQLKMEEVLAYETRPHPVEFELYYSV